MPVITLPIEVKGAWNSDLLTFMGDQLVGRYMRDLQASCGLFVVLWPDLEFWRTGRWGRAAVARLDRDEVVAELAAQAQRVATTGSCVEVVHLDMSYLRPAVVAVRRSR